MGVKESDLTEEEYWDYSEDAPKPDDNILKELEAAVIMLWRAQQRTAALDAKVAEAAKIEEHLRTKELPDIMKRGGGMLREITVEVEPGHKVTVILDENHVSAKLSEGKKDAVFKYLREAGYEHLVSSNVVVPFTKGQEELREQFKDFLATCELPITPGEQEEIHSSTYTALCKKLVDANAPIDHKIFGIHVQSRVKLVEPKTKRKSKKEL